MIYVCYVLYNIQIVHGIGMLRIVYHIDNALYT